jgi:glucoamylase
VYRATAAGTTRIPMLRARLVVALLLAGLLFPSFGTAYDTRSKVWFTLGRAGLQGVYWPTADEPSARSLELVVVDGRRVERESTAARGAVTLADPRSLTYRQVTTARTGRWRITKTYASDPARDALLIDVDVRSLSGDPLRVYVVFDPALLNGGSDDRGSRRGATLLATDDGAASALAATPALRSLTSGIAGRSDILRDLRDGRLDRTYARTRRGNVVQGARAALDGVRSIT